MALATPIARRATHTFARAAWRKASTISIRTPCLSSNLKDSQTRIYPSLSRFIRRELSTILPFHSAIASACLVSKLPTQVSPSIEGRFANYVSPI